MTTQEMKAAIEAFERDGVIEIRNKDSSRPWASCKKPMWNFDHYDYRPVQKPAVVFSVFDSQDRLVCSSDNEKRAKSWATDDSGRYYVRLEQVGGRIYPSEKGIDQ